MKKYLKVEYGSRGEMEVFGLVDSGYDVIRKELDEIVSNCDDEGMVEYYEEFMFLNEDVEKGVIEVGVGEEESYTYIEYDKNKEGVDEILRIDGLCREGKMEWNDGDVVVDMILSEIV